MSPQTGCSADEEVEVDELASDGGECEQLVHQVGFLSQPLAAVQLLHNDGIVFLAEPDGHSDKAEHLLQLVFSEMEAVTS
jgi:hypothetical protein